MQRETTVSRLLEQVQKLYNQYGPEAVVHINCGRGTGVLLDSALLDVGVGEVELTLSVEWDFKLVRGLHLVEFIGPEEWVEPTMKEFCLTTSQEVRSQTGSVVGSLAGTILKPQPLQELRIRRPDDGKAD